MSMNIVQQYCELSLVWLYKIFFNASIMLLFSTFWGEDTKAWYISGEITKIRDFFLYNYRVGGYKIFVSTPSFFFRFFESLSQESKDEDTTIFRVVVFSPSGRHTQNNYTYADLGCILFNTVGLDQLKENFRSRKQDKFMFRL